MNATDNAQKLPNVNGMTGAKSSYVISFLVMSFEIDF